MATSGNMSTTNQYIKYTISCTQKSQNINSNSSVVNVQVRIFRTNTGYTTYGTGTVYCKINGTTYTAGITPSQGITENGIVVFSRDVTIGHNADGSKTLTMSAWFSHDMFSSGEQSYSQALTTIPRASSFTLSSTDVVAGAVVTGTISRASSSFTHKVALHFGTKQWTLATGVATSFSVTIPLDAMLQIPNATKGQGGIHVTTYNGSTEVGKKSLTFLISVPSSVAPTFSTFSIARIDNNVPPAWGLYVQGQSGARLNMSEAVTQYGATVRSYEISGGGYSATGRELVTGPINQSGTVVFTAKVTDSRGLTATKTITVNVIPYSPPKIESFTAVRCNSTGVENDEGQYIKAIGKWSYSSVNSKNSLTSVVSYTVKDQNTWKGDTTLVNNTAKTCFNNEVSSNSAHQIRLLLTDALTTSMVVVEVGTGLPLMDFRSGGKGIAFGKVAETDGMEVNLDLTQLKNANFKGGLQINGVNIIDVFYPVGSIYMGVNNVNPSTFMGGEWTAWGSGRVPVGVDTSEGRFDTVEKKGGSILQQLRALIGAVGGNKNALGYQAVAPVSGASYTSTYGISASAGPSAGAPINHSTIVLTANGTTPDNLQPYITCYMWKRTK